MRRGFTLLEVLLASVILGAGLTTVLVSMSMSQRMMMVSPELETAQEVMDLGEMAYPIEAVQDEDDLDVGEQSVSDLWDLISDERLTSEQQEKYHGYTWKREALNKTDKEEDIKRLGNLYTARVTVTWGARGQGSGKKQQESYVTFWRKSE